MENVRTSLNWSAWISAGHNMDWHVWYNLQGSLVDVIATVKATIFAFFLDKTVTMNWSEEMVRLTLWPQKRRQPQKWRWPLKWRQPQNWRGPQKWRWPKNEDDLKNEDDPKNENDPYPTKETITWNIFLIPSHLNSHRTTDIKPEMLSGVQTGIQLRIQ